MIPTATNQTKIQLFTSFTTPPFGTPGNVSATRPKLLPFPLSCSNCSKLVGTLLIHNYNKIPAKELGALWAQYTCTTCASSSSIEQATSSVLTPTKPSQMPQTTLQHVLERLSFALPLYANEVYKNLPTSVDEDRGVKAECAVCRLSFGFGCVYFEVFSSNGDLEGNKAIKMKEGTQGKGVLVELGVGVEMVCKGCEEKHRTGKWKPRELFIDNRRTCSLSHVRLGNVDSHDIEIFSMDEDPIKGKLDIVMKECRIAYNDCFKNVFGSPEVIETFTSSKSFPPLLTYLSTRFSTVQKIIDFHTNPNKNVENSTKLYIALLKITDSHSRKPKPTELNNPSNTSHPLSKRKMLGGYAWATFNPATRHMVVLDLVLRVPGTRGAEMERRMVRGLVERCMRDYTDGCRDLLKWNEGEGDDGVVSMVVEAGLARFSAQMGKVGFTDQYRWTSERPVREDGREIVEAVCGHSSNDNEQVEDEAASALEGELRILLKERKGGVVLSMKFSDAVGDEEERSLIKKLEGSRKLKSKKRKR
ncbi:hypothetical protein HDV05_005410 [Chytridiales sp. JEL 0842]|nr:hypothetical protein HDV05_005410 [Chytridiales sp. JEL 0842]